MDKTSPPTTFGVFKPVGHTVVVYADAAAAEAGAAELKEKGFGGDTITRYTAAEMRAQAAADQASASPLAGLGYELELMGVYDSFAERGASFLVVHAPESGQSDQVADIARATRALAAHHYNTLAIEEVTGLQP
jgi:hypothetical protein